jgi:rhamnosyltransferase
VLRPRSVVVVDSGSSDGTLDIVRSFPTTLVQIEPDEFTYGYALNLGVAAAEGELIATLSAHSTPINGDWLPNLIAPFSQPRVAGVYGRQQPRSNATQFERLGMRMTGVLSEKPKLLDRRPLFSNANGAFRRALWMEHPFDEQIRGAEDIAWVRTMQERGYLIAYEPTAVVYHSHGEPLLQHFRRATRDVPTIVGNWFHLGAGDDRRPAPDTTSRPAVEPD